jgi:hypothetical protein
MCTVLLPPGVNPTAVKYIITYHIKSVMYNGLSPTRDLISKYHTYDGGKLSLFGLRGTYKTRGHTLTTTFLTFNEKRLDIQHNAAGS